LRAAYVQTPFGAHWKNHQYTTSNSSPAKSPFRQGRIVFFAKAQISILLLTSLTQNQLPPTTQAILVEGHFLYPQNAITTW